MPADEQRRQGHLDTAELKNLHTVVLDLEEIKQFHLIAKRSRVRSILSREISNLEEKILSSSNGSDEKVSQEEDSSQVILADTSSKRKHKKIDESESSMMKKKPKLAATRKPLVVNGRSCKTMEEKPHQQQTRTSEQVFSSWKRSWCRICRVPTHAESRCWLRSAICSYCHKRGHLKTRCPKVPRGTVSLSPSARIIVTAGGSCKNTQGKPNRQSLPTRASERILLDEAASSDVIKRSTMAVNAIENADVSEKPNQNTIKEPLVMIGSSSESTQEELNQQTLPTRTSEQVSWKKANPSDVNKASLLTTVATENNNLLNQMGQTIASPMTTSALGFKLVSPQKGRFRHTCQLTDVKSDCFRCNGTCFNCQKTGHIMAHCPELTEKTTSPCGKIVVTAGSSCETTQKELNKQSLTISVSEQVMLDKNVSSDVNKTSTMAVVATENADVSKKEPIICTVKEPIVIIGSRCESTLEEPNQRSLQTRTSERVLWEKANPSDVNEISLRAVVTFENADVSNKTSQTMPQGTAASSGSRLGSSRKKKRRRRCNLPNHAESECVPLNVTCLTCQKMGHFAANCPQINARDVISPSGTRTTAAASSCTSMQEEQNQQPLPTKTSENILPEKSIPFDTNKASPVTVFAIKNVDVSSKKSKTMTKGTASSRSRVASSRKMPWCCTCKLPASECSLKGSCLNCHEMGHSSANCPKKITQDAFSLSGTGKITAGSSPTSTPVERNQQSLQKVSAVVNATSGMAVVATKNGDVSNKTGQSMIGRAPLKGKISQISQEKTQKTTHKGISTQSEATIAISEPKAVPSKKGSWCYTCQRHHANSCPCHSGAHFKYSQMGHFVSGYPLAHQRVSNLSSNSVQDAVRYDWWLHGGAWNPVWVDPFQPWN